MMSLRLGTSKLQGSSWPSSNAGLAVRRAAAATASCRTTVSSALPQTKSDAPRKGQQNPGPRHKAKGRGSSKRAEYVALNKKIASLGSVDNLEALILDEVTRFNTVNISTAAGKLAKLHQRHGSTEKAAELISVLSGVAMENIGDFQGRALSNFSWAVAKIGMKGYAPERRDELLQALELQALKCWQSGTFRVPHELSMMLWSFAKLNHNPVAFLDAIEQCDFAASPLLKGLGPQEVANVAWAFAKMGEVRPALLNPLAIQAKSVISTAAPKELSITVWSFAKLEHVSVEVEELVETCAREAEGSLNTYSSMDLSNLAYACAHLRVACVNSAPSRLMEMVIFEATPRLAEFSPQGIANFIWSMAKAGAETPEAMDAAATAADERVYSLTPQGWATILWAFAKADLPITPKIASMLDSIAAAAAAAGPSLDSQNMANIAWALGSLEHYSLAADHLLDVVSVEATRRRHEFTPQGIANLCWGFARLGAHTSSSSVISDSSSNSAVSPVNLRSLFGSLTPRIVMLGPQLGAQDVAMISWAVGRLGFFHQELLDCLAVRAEASLGDFTPQGLSNTVWAFASLNRYPVSLLDAIATRVVTGALPLSGFTGQGIANLAWAYAKLDYVKPAGFMEAIAAESAPRLEDFSAQSICSLVVSAADLVSPCPALFEAVDAQVVSRLPEFRGAYSESLMSSYASLGYNSSAALPLLGEAAESALLSLANVEPGFFGAGTQWDKRRCKHYTALMVEIFCSGTLPNMPNSGVTDRSADELFLPSAEADDSRAAFLYLGESSQYDSRNRRTPPRKL